MSISSNKAFRYTALGIKFLEKVFHSKFNITGIENIPNQPILFVCNHFTRSETFIIPYIIYKYTKRQVRCLADDGLFSGILGKFLSKIGALSTKNSNRDNTIISDLITGDYDWMIYPEGSMIKSKEIYRTGSFVNQTSHGLSATRTGSAVLGLKSELYRMNYVDAKKNGRKDVMEYYEKQFDVKYNESLDKINTYIVPVNITYYPIRPGDNAIKGLMNRIFKTLPHQIIEEFEIEGNLILSSHINVHFGEAINLAEYLKPVRETIYKIPIIKDETKTNLILRYLKTDLTARFMAAIYSATKINIDHIFCAILYHSRQDTISVRHLANLVYLSAKTIRKAKKYKISYSIKEENLFKILINEPHLEYDDIIKLAVSRDIIKLGEDKEYYQINRERLNRKYDFHQIRLENPLQVIANEFFLLDVANSVIRRNVTISEAEITKKVFAELVASDMTIFKEDYKKYYDEKLSKAEIIGAPFFLDGKSDVGILVCHGYQSAPKETEGLAQYLNKFGFKVYGARLKGHGTSPRNINDITWQEWYDSMQRGYAALKTICSRVVIIGFSTGGLLALLSAARKDCTLASVVSINAAFKLKDIRARMVPGVSIWNDLLEKFHIEKGRLEYVDNISENPTVNYSLNYLEGVKQLSLLMEESYHNLEKITAPTLLIHGVYDPIVDGKKGGKIIEIIKSEDKKLVELDLHNHIIIVGDGKEKVFEEIRIFLNEQNLIPNN